MSSITNIDSTDLITDSRADINNNFSALNTDKIETSVLDTDTTLAADSDSKVATQKAVKAYVDAGGNVNATETTKGIVEIATAAEVAAGTATGSTGASLVVTPDNLPGTTQIVYDVADSPATWTKDTGLKRIRVQAWGAGGSGACSTSSNNGGGGGGSYAERWFEAADLGATETVTIGAGGTAVGPSSDANGVAGGNTTFGSLLTAYGGGAGFKTNTAADYTGGGGGGPLSAGGSGGSASALNAGSPGAPVAGSGIGESAIYGGGGGRGSDAGGGSYYSGGGGGGATNIGSQAGGTSVFGGNGGAGGYNDTSGTAGSVLGGGGGGAERVTTSVSGAGGDGQVIVTEYYV